MAVQVTFPAAMHKATAEAVKQAIFLIPAEKKPPSYTAVKQGMQESYGSFVNRLVQSLEQTLELSDDLRRQMLWMLAFENANDKTKMLIATLPKNAPIDEMLERVSETSRQTDYVTEAVKGAVSVKLKPLKKLFQLRLKPWWQLHLNL